MKTTRTRTSRLLSLIHWTLGLGVPTVAAIMFGCIKAPKISPDDLGPAVAEQDVEREISKAIYGADPRKIEVGQEVWYDINMRIENQDDVRPISELNQKVLKVKDEPAALTITVLTKETPANGDPIDVKESEIVFKKSADLTSTLHETAVEKGLIEAGGEYFTPFSLEALGRAGMSDVQINASRPVKKITYHNLKVSNDVINPPEAARLRPNCADVKDCLLPVTNLGYDEVYWFSDTEYEVARYQYTLSKATPYLALIVEKCLAGFIHSGDRRFFVRQCEFLRDFKPRTSP